MAHQGRWTVPAAATGPAGGTEYKAGWVYDSGVLGLGPKAGTSEWTLTLTAANIASGAQNQVFIIEYIA